MPEQRTFTRNACRRPAGFSLVEMLVVIAIIGMMLTMAVPNFVRYRARDRVEIAASDVTRALILARQKALSRRTSYRMVVSGTPPTLQVERRAAGAWVPDPVAPITLPDGVQLTCQLGATPGQTVLTLEPQGTIAANCAPATLSFQNSRGDSARVTMVRTGRIRMRVH